MACHDDSRWWQGHHHPMGDWQRSWEAQQLSEIIGSDLPSFLSFHSAGGGTWAVASCRNDVVRLAYFSQRSGQTYPNRICRSSRCDMAVVQMWCLRVSCASPWGSSDRGSAPRVSLGEIHMELIRIEIRATCHQGEGSLQTPPTKIN